MIDTYPWKAMTMEGISNGDPRIDLIVAMTTRSDISMSLDGVLIDSIDISSLSDWIEETAVEKVRRLWVIYKAILFHR